MIKGGVASARVDLEREIGIYLTRLFVDFVVNIRRTDSHRLLPSWFHQTLSFRSASQQPIHRLTQPGQRQLQRQRRSPSKHVQGDLECCSWMYHKTGT